MEMSQSVEWLNKPFEGYVVNAEFSPENKRKILEVIARLSAGLGDSIFTMPEKSLHITLLDWIAPLVDYDGQDKSSLFEQVEPKYKNIMHDAISKERAILVKFDKIHVSPTTIFITGSDNGEFQRIRDYFISKATLLPGTKKPPQIIHSSLARFTKPVGLDKAYKLTQEIEVGITELISEFRLMHTSKEPMLEYEVLKTYLTGLEPR